MEKRKKIGMAFPGGGCNGAFQAGVAKSAEERGIKIDYIIASSIGCINAAILGAKDGNAEKLCEFWQNIMGYHFLYPAWKEWLVSGRIDSFCSSKKIEEQLLRVANIYEQRSDIDIDISLLSLDSRRIELVSNHVSYFREVLQAGIGMAPIYPAVFLPQRGSQYVDGGLGRNFMIPKCFENGCDKVILVNLIETQKTQARAVKKLGTVRDLKGVFWQTAKIVIKRVFADSSGQDEYDNEKVLKIFSPRGTYFSTLFPSNWWFRQMIQAGYEEAERAFSSSPLFREK